MRKLIAVVVALSALWASRCQSAEPVFKVQLIEPPAAVEPAKPILTYYVGDPSWRCLPCDAMKADLATNTDELPFRVVISTKRPGWVTFVPVAVWETGHDGPRQLEGWHGRRELVARYKRSLVPDVKPAGVSASKARSPQWPAVRKRHIDGHPNCVVCGRKAEEVHHLRPFHLEPSLELEPSNLRSLCRDCHFAVGHLWNFSNENPDLDAHAEMLRTAKRAADERRKHTPTSGEAPRANPAGPAATATVVAGVKLHAHRCEFDGTIWWHDGTGPDHAAAHRCPKCGRLQYVVHQ